MLQREKSIEIVDSPKSGDKDEDDCEYIFLQPASSPYNISEKVRQANESLELENYDTVNRNTKIKFKEQLVDYEPTSDVTATESEEEAGNDDENDILYVDIKNEEIEQTVPDSEPTEPKNTVQLNMIHFNKFVETEEEEEILEEEEVESIEEDSLNTIDEVVYVEEIVEEHKVAVMEQEKTPPPAPTPQPNVVKPQKRKSASAPPKPQTHPIDCKNHCIERLDLGLNLSINKLSLQEKPVDCPKLKLQQRVCCEKNKQTNPQTLPTYHGLRSEYGLNLVQLERRERRKEIARQKQISRQKMIEESKARKAQQNEEVFRKWLKDIAKRKEQCQARKNTKVKKEPFSPSVVNLDVKYKKERPQTANEFVDVQRIIRPKKKRSFSAKVYIQVPPELLREGVSFGELLVSAANARNLRVVAF